MRTEYLWTPERDNWLETNAKNLTLKELQAHLRIGKEVIKNRCNRLGVKWKPSPHPGRPSSWTPQEDKILCNSVKAGYPYKRISKMLEGRSPFLCEKRYLQIQKQLKPSLTLDQILQMDLSEGQRQTAISFFEENPSWAENYIKNIQQYRNKRSNEPDDTRYRSRKAR